ncbi:MAG: sulfatase-like hydrolase/transferase [Roseburia sp.]|nr:sulfatase-like hydrolase/transferase [Roseburia sp.]
MIMNQNIMCITSHRRNIVYIICDQLRYDYLSAYGADFIPTPNIDSLSANGVIFDNAITAAPVCGPARASIVTGQHVSTHGCWTNNIPCKAGTVYLADRLNAAGYMTAAVGSFDHAPFGDPIGYRYLRRFDEDHKECEYLKELKERHPEATTSFMKEDMHFKYREEEHYDSWSCDRAIEFMESYSKTGVAPDGSCPDVEDAPFFLYCGFLMPHAPYLPPKEVSGSVDPDRIPEPWILERDDIPSVEQYRRAFLNPSEALENPRSVFPVRKKERLAYCEMIVAIDYLVGRVVKALKELGIYENTTIIFSADHGDMENDYNISTKGPWPYSPSLFIPMIISNHPQLAAGSRSDVLCGNLDIGATVLDIAGDNKAFGVSRSMIGMVNGQVAERSVNLSEFCDSCKFLVDKRYTFTYYPFTGVYTLFDRLEDPRFTTNLALLPEYTATVQHFLMKVIDYMILAKGVHIEAHDMAPDVKAGIEGMNPKFLEDFDIYYPLGNMEEVERVRRAGLDENYNEFCKGREIKAHYGVYFKKDDK